MTIEGINRRAACGSHSASVLAELQGTLIKFSFDFYQFVDVIAFLPARNIRLVGVDQFNCAEIVLFALPHVCDVETGLVVQDSVFHDIELA